MIIRRSFRLALLLAAGWGGHAAAAVPPYFACEQDADCVLVQGVCGLQAGANAEKKADAEAYFEAMQAMMKCKKPVAAQGDRQAVCDAGRCAVRGDKK